MSANFTFSKWDLLKRIFDEYKRHAFYISAIFFLIFLFLWSLNQFYTHYYFTSEDIKIKVLVFSIYFIANIYTGISMIYLALNIDRGSKIKAKEFLNLFDRFISFVVLIFSFTVMFYLGILFFVVPALWVLASFSFAPYILIDKNYSVFKSFVYSYKISKGHKINILIFYLFLFILNFLAALTIVGLFVSVPLTILSVAHLYRALACIYEHSESKDRCGVKIKLLEFWQKFWAWVFIVFVAILGAYSAKKRIQYWTYILYSNEYVQSVKNRLLKKDAPDKQQSEAENIEILRSLQQDINLFKELNGRAPHSLEELGKGYENSTVIYLEYDNYYEACDSISFVCFKVEK